VPGRLDLKGCVGLLGTASIVVPIKVRPDRWAMGRPAMRIESSVTSLSWIPLGAVEGFNRLSFGLHVAH
jgi:hypothetical protein